MTTNHQDAVLKPLDDWLSIALFRTVQELTLHDFKYSAERDLARAELHGERLEKLVTPLFEPGQLTTQAAEVGVLVNKLKEIPVEVAKAAFTEHVDSLPGYRIRQRILDLISYLNMLKAKGYSLDPGDEAFLCLTPDQQEALGKQIIKRVADVLFPEIWSVFLSILEVVTKAKAVPTIVPPIQEACLFIPWRMTLEVVPLADDPPLTKRLLCPENDAVVTDREGDPEKAFELLYASLRVRLEAELKLRGWCIPGPRYEESDEFEQFLNDEPELLQIGLFKGMKWAREKSLQDLLVNGANGKLRNALKKAAKNELFMEIRRKNNQLGIEVLPHWIREAKVEERKVVKEVPEYDIKIEDGSISIIQQAHNRQAFREWGESDTEEQARALKIEKIRQLCQEARLKPRLQLVANLYNKPDETIASALRQMFGKPVSLGAVRKLRHDLVLKLRKIATKK